MLIETGSDKKVRLVGPHLNTAIVLRPGEPVEVSPELGRRVLRQYAPKVRLARSQWITAWRELADLTSGIEQSEPRFKPLINVLEQADRVFERDNWEEFQKAASRVLNIANKGS